MNLDVPLAVAAAALALWLRPWRCVGSEGPPWPWAAGWLLLWLAWSVAPDATLRPSVAVVALLLLMAGWPLAVLCMLGAALLATLATPLHWELALQRLVWTGLVPATGMLAAGAAVRRWLPPHLFAYVLGRGWLGTLLASLLVGFIAPEVLWEPGPAGTDRWVAHLLLASGEAGLCAMLVGLTAVLRPRWLATYSERLYPLP